MSMAEKQKQTENYTSNLQNLQAGIKNGMYKKGDLSNLNDDFAPSVTGHDLVVCAEHVIEFIHRIDKGPDFA